MTVSATARFTIASLPAGSHAFRSVYSGDAHYQAVSSDASAPVQVATASTSTTLTATTSAGGVTLTASVTSTSPGSPAIAGTVSFYDGDTLQGTVPVLDGVATFNIAFPSGVHSCHASFSGGANSASGASVTVGVAGPKVVGLSRYGLRPRRTSLVLKFDARSTHPLQNLANYQLRRRNGHRIAIKSATYDASTNSVTLVPAGHIGPFRTYTLSVSGKAPNGVAGSSGVALDSSGDGQPGTAFATKVRWTALSLPGRSPAVTFANGQAHAYAGRFRQYVRVVLRTTLAAMSAMSTRQTSRR